jgi:hypothetical protein
MFFPASGRGSAILAGASTPSRIALAAALCLAAAACARAPESPIAAADPAAPARPVEYRPVLSGYESARPADPAPWRDRNQSVAPKEKTP